MDVAYALVQQQAENSRKRILFGMHNLGQRQVVYWWIDTPIEDYGVVGISLTREETILAANIRT
ncbi:hypothetical protein, partial [Afipia birgiae]|uniref:hypothetical protein n=1 Tax=Afipia birgiae TaxID=151414 RepID=UPI001AEBEEBD